MRNPEKRHHEEPSKPSKLAFEGFEGDHECHVLENHCHVEGGDVAVKNSKNATPAYPQNVQNPSAPTDPDGTGCKIEIVELPQAGRYRKVFGVLQLRPPALVPIERWQQAIEDGRRFLATWGSQAEALGWTLADLFGLHQPPAKPHPSYNRLSRYDATGLIWLLEGGEVIALTADTASIRNRNTGNITVFRKNNRPALAPLGDSIDDIDPRWRQ